MLTRHTGGSWKVQGLDCWGGGTSPTVQCTKRDSRGLGKPKCFWFSDFPVPAPGEAAGLHLLTWSAYSLVAGLVSVLCVKCINGSTKGQWPLRTRLQLPGSQGKFAGSGWHSTETWWGGIAGSSDCDQGSRVSMQIESLWSISQFY